MDLFENHSSLDANKAVYHVYAYSLATSARFSDFPVQSKKPSTIKSGTRLLRLL
ncbi:hypothetical protein PHMEG_00010233 [Phytophthora megakarya]|uniref:Uncharacterized protein n=1 Tax=Phytophthora megakarya TaxID=4795 RepID=A0A225WFY9_9STRA|nr:hypothetical protein PHMEG_00010233 [Phytophthora megakarya]